MPRCSTALAICVGRALELGLRALWGGGLEGEYRGLQVRLWNSPYAGHSEVRITLDEPILPGMRLHSAKGGVLLAGEVGPMASPHPRQVFADGRLVVWGPRAPLRALLEHPDVARILRELSDANTRICWDDCQVAIHEEGAYLEDYQARLDRAVDLVMALETVWRAPWLAVAKRYGLRVEGDGERPSLAGSVAGVPVVVHLQRDEHGELLLRATAQLRNPLPAGVRIQHADRGTPRDVQLGDLILDELLFVEAPTQTNLAERLNREAVRGPLLEALHGHPGSVLTSERIGVLVRDRVLDPGYALDLVLSVESALVGPSASSTEG